MKIGNVRRVNCGGISQFAILTWDDANKVIRMDGQVVPVSGIENADSAREFVALLYSEENKEWRLF